MLVPTCRGSAWVVEFHAASEALTAVQALRAQGVDVREDTGSPVARKQQANIDADIERLSMNSEFRALVADIEGALARRESLGLPDLLTLRPLGGR